MAKTPSSQALPAVRSCSAVLAPILTPILVRCRLRAPSPGIGAACAIALAEAGANVCLVRRPGSTNDETANAIAATGRNVKIVECDLADLEAVKGLFQKALDAMGGEIHILVNCAGIQRRSPAVQFPESDWDDVRVSCLTQSYSFLSSLSGFFPFPPNPPSDFDSFLSSRHPY